MSIYFNNPGDFIGFDINSDIYFVKNGYTLELWFKGVLVHSWTVDAPSTGVGQPMGLLLTLTYAS